MNTRDDRWWNIPAVLCLFAALMTTAFRVESTEWTTELGVLKWLTLIAFILGVGLGYSKFKGFLVQIFAFFYTITILPWLLIIQTPSDAAWLDRLHVFLVRINDTGYYYLHNIRIEDTILFTLFFAVLTWIIAFIGGYTVVRTGKPWAALIISGITILVSEFYYANDKFYFSAAFLVFSLLLISQTNLMFNMKSWRAKGTLVEFETTFNISRSALIVGLILIFFVWSFSSVFADYTPGGGKQKKLFGVFEDIRNEVVKITNSIQGSLTLEQEFYGDTVGLGSGTVLGNERVFTVKVNRFKPFGSRYYWRARTYDQYINHQWTNTITTEQLVMEGDVIEIPPSSIELPERTFVFSTETNLGMFYTPIYPTIINQNATIIGESINEFGVDIVAIITERTLFPGEEYEIRAFVDDPTVWEMRESSIEYPDWITDHYLQLPDDFSEKIHDLAIEITQDEDNPYDKTIAITNYLRKNYPYKQIIPPTPADQDPIEWFLFDLKEGFCNYYASAQVLMLRSIGIPARMVYGYAQGEEDVQHNTYMVLRRDSHAWPEVYFSGIGWVEFEPTAGQPALSRLVGNPSTQSNVQVERTPTVSNPFNMDDIESRLEREQLDRALPGEFIIEEPEPSFVNSSTMFSIGWSLIIAGLVLFFIQRTNLGITFKAPMYLERFIIKRGWKTPQWLKRWSDYVQLSEAERAFAMIVWILYLYKTPPPTSSTPAELVTRFSKLLPELGLKAEQMLVEYQKALYSEYKPDLPFMKKTSKELIRDAVTIKVRKLFITEDSEEYSFSK